MLQPFIERRINFNLDTWLNKIKPYYELIITWLVLSLSYKNNSRYLFYNDLRLLENVNSLSVYLLLVYIQFNTYVLFLRKPTNICALFVLSQDFANKIRNAAAWKTAGNETKNRRSFNKRIATL